MIGMRRVIWLSAIGSLVLAGCSNGGTVAGGGGDPKRPVTLRINLKAGEKQTQTTETDVSGTSQGKSFKSHVTVVTTQEVVSASGGQFAIKTAIVEANATGDNAAATNSKLAELKGRSYTMTMNDHGKILDMGGIDKDPVLGQMFQNAKFSELPDKAIKPGDTWTVNAEAMGIAITGEMKSAGIEMVDGQEALRVESSVKIPILPEPMKSTTWFSIASGMPIKAESENKINVMGAEVLNKTTMTSK